MVVTHMIDPDTGERERIRFDEANHYLKAADAVGHPVHVHNRLAQGTPEESSQALVTVLSVHSKTDPEIHDPGGRLLAVFEITDPTFVARMTEA